MAGHLVERSSAGLWFAVDGERVEVGWHLYPHLWAGGAFTTDYEQMRRLLPLPPLHPLEFASG